MFLWLINFLRRFLLCDTSLTLAWVVISLISLWFLTFSIVFPKFGLLINLKSHDLMLVLNPLCVWIIIFHYASRLQVFWLFLMFILSGKKGESLWGLFRFSGYWIWFPRKYPSSLSSFVVFYEIFIMKTICKQLRHPYKLFTSQYLRYDDFPFLL